MGRKDEEKAMGGKEKGEGRGGGTGMGVKV